MQKLSAAEEKKVRAKIDAFDFSAYSRRLPNSFVNNYASCVDRDFKLWAQIAVFVLDDIISDDALQVWIYVSECHIYCLISKQLISCLFVETTK